MTNIILDIPTREAMLLKARANVATGSHDVGSAEMTAKYCHVWEDDFPDLDIDINPLPFLIVDRTGEGFVKAEDLASHYKNLFSHGYSEEDDSDEE